MFFAKLAQQLGKRDLDGTRNRARAAKRRRVGKIERVLQADVTGREHRAHRAGVDPAVAVPSDRPVYGTVVHAGPASDAAQHLLHVAAHEIGAAGVDQDEDHVLGAVAVLRPARTGEEAHVVGDRLAGRRSRQEPEQGREILQRREHLLDAGDAHVHARQRRHHAPVAFVRDDHARSGFGDQKVAARDAEIGREEMLPQHFARFAGHARDVVLARRVVMGLEQVGDVLFALVKRRSDDVRRRLPGELKDVFSEVGLDRRDPVRR